MNAHFKPPALPAIDEALPKDAAAAAITIKPTGMAAIRLWALDECVAIEQGEEIVAIPKRLITGFTSLLNDFAAGRT